MSRQYLGSIGKIEQGIVTVNAYGVYEQITFPLMFKVFKPKGTLKAEDQFKTKIQLASEIITELISFGFEIELVLADSLYGESSSFIQTLNQHHLSWIVAIRSNHGVWMHSNQRVRANKWSKFERTFSNQTSEIRYVREIIFGKKSLRTYWEITTDPETMPENSTSFVMTNLRGKTHQIKKSLGNLYGAECTAACDLELDSRSVGSLRTWIEYGFRQCKQELGWTDYRFTKLEQIEKWWEIIMSGYLMISLNSKIFCSLNCSGSTPNSDEALTDCPHHQQWNHQGGWKNTLNNLRLIIQPIMLLWWISPWLDVFPNRYLLLGFHQLIDAVNQFHSYFPDG